jgi:hypothetical protein
MMAKPARRRTDNVLTMPSIDSPTEMLAASGIGEADMARRAFELYCDRGREDGHDEDWPNANGNYQRILQRVRAEYLEMPGMKLRIEQLQRLCGMNLQPRVVVGRICRRGNVPQIRKVTLRAFMRRISAESDNSLAVDRHPPFV